MINKKWQISQEIGNDFIKKFPELDPVVLQMLWNRGIKNDEKINNFIYPEFSKHFHDPFLFNEMEKAVDLIIQHIKAGNKIMIYGDYDADGVTSSAIMTEVLQVFKAQVDVYLPHRVKEGYGLNRKAIDFIKDGGSKLIITVDGGIRSKEEVKYAKKQGLDIIVTDHHMPPLEDNDLPECIIINPSVKKEKYPFKFLSGAGVAFKLVSALIQKSKLEEADKQKLIKMNLDLAAVGTVADCVSLVDENRVIVKEGLKILQNTKKKGLLELIKISKLDLKKTLCSWNIGFQLAPRINAAGRLDHANTAYKLLVTKNDKEARSLANNLNQKNIERQKMTEKIMEEVDKQIKKPLKDQIIIGVYSFDGEAEEEDAWSEGIIGLVAGRICEKYYRPTLVITKTSEGYKGSGRSIEDFNLIASVEQCADVLDRYGGHPAACGFSLQEKNLEVYKEKLTKIANKELAGKKLQPVLRIETELNLEKIDEEFFELINLFEPFGQDNPKPKFVSFGISIVDIIHMGAERQHIKLKLKNNNSKIINAIGFSQAEKWADLNIGDIIDIVYYIDLNEFNGRKEVQLKIIDMKLC